MATCGACGGENPDEFRFCVLCGGPLGLRCPACGAETSTSFLFCGMCGASLSAPDEPSEPLLGEVPPTSRASERRRMTVLFADIVGSSTFAEDMDPEQLESFLTDVLGELTAQVEAAGGSVERILGDAVLATFGAFQVHEDDPVRAVLSALAMQEAVARMAASAPVPVAVRVGIHTGLVVRGTIPGGGQTELFGDSVHVASRLQSAAGSGGILVSDRVWRRARDHVDGEHVGPISLTGRRQPVDAWRVLAVHRKGPRRASPFVGRRDELALLELLWSNAAKGITHVVSLVGESGVGKSRLLSELPPRPDAFDVRTTCTPERAFGPFLDIMESLLGAVPRDLEDLSDRCARFQAVDSEVMLLIGALLGLAGAPPVVPMADNHQQRQAFAGVWLFLQAVAAERPILLVLDELHAADRSSLDLMGFLLERLHGSPAMVVVAHRPGFELIDRVAIRANHTGVRLEMLTAEESVALARGVLGVAELPVDLERLVATRAEGNPFFIEELLQALLELGSLEVIDGKAILARTEIDIPDTVEATILARLDRLGSWTKTVLQHAAVIGRSFSNALLAATLDQSDDLEDRLAELSRAQLIVAEGPMSWTFRHALIREVTYETLLVRQRRELHRRVAQALEPDVERDPSLLELVAEHYAHAESPDEARRYALAAGDAARERLGFVEARDRYQTALRLWGEGDERGRLELLMKLGYAELLSADATAARATLVEAVAGWRALGEVTGAGAALSILGRVYFFTGETQRAVESLQEAVGMLEPLGSSPELMRAIIWASTVAMLAGRVGEGADLAARGLAMDPGALTPGARSHLLDTLGACQVYGGDPTGLLHITEAMSLAEESRDAEAIGRAYLNAATTRMELAMLAEGLEITRRGRQVTRRLGAPSFELLLAAREAEMLAWGGDYVGATALCHEILGPRRPLLVVPGVIFANLTLALVQTRIGRFAEARDALDAAMPLARRIEGSMFLVPALWREAELEEANGNLASARLAMREAADLGLASPSLAHVVWLLVPAARLLDGESARRLLEHVAPAASHPAFDAHRLEARAVLDADPGAFLKAGDLYASLGLRYEQARCLLDAGEVASAAAIVHDLGAEQGPLGRMLETAR